MRNGLTGAFKALLCLSVLIGCTIEPPLHLPLEDVMTEMPLVETNIEAIWDVDADWRGQWWYGWDEDDIEEMGRLEYPDPTYFEVRRFYQGEEPSGEAAFQDGFTVYGKQFRRRYSFGYYDLLVWSNIDSDDGTQTVLIDEHDRHNIIASTTQTKVSYPRAPSRVVPLKNQPEIFYDAYSRNFYISRNKEDYDYFDEKENAWVKVLNTTLKPVVYLYLVQVAIYNNNGKIVGLADNATITNLSEGVNLNTGRTLLSNVDVVYAMRMKKGLPARDNRKADILGGKFTTFGLCDMEPWNPTRGPLYSGSRADLKNDVMLNLRFSNSSDAVYTYDVTRQLQSKAHGGVITIEIDADTITVPTSGSSAGSGFRPTVEEYEDSITHEFGI